MVASSSSLPLFLLLLIASSSCDLLSATDVNDEVPALQSMKNLLDPQGVVLTNWNPVQVNPCTYDFVTCSDENVVISLKVPSHNLSGRLSPRIGNLTHLETLVLADNNITGTIPAEIGNLGRLKKLNLSSNHLHGEIPSSVLHLQSLRYLDLSYNNLSGPIPKSFTGTLYIVGNPLICGDNKGQDCSSSRSPPAAASYNFVVAFGSTVACIVFLFFPIS